MAIVQKHGLGQQVTVQGCRINTGLGVIYVPEDKLQRALREIDATVAGPVSVRAYHSLISFLQSLTCVVGASRSASYGLFAPLAGSLALDPEATLTLPHAIKAQLLTWKQRLLQCAGAPLHAAVDRQTWAGLPPAVVDAPVAFYLRSDASKEGARLPGLGGALGGTLWRYPADAPLAPDELGLPIGVLEFAAYYGTVEVFAATVDADALVVSEVDALASADALTAESARSALMQLVHARLLAMPAFVALKRRHAVGHIFGDANIMADAASRGDYDVARDLAAQLGMALQWLPHGPLLPALMRDLVALHQGAAPPNTALAQTTHGTANLNMVGSPIAHRLLACSCGTQKARARTPQRRPLRLLFALGPPNTALAQTTRGCANLHMVGSPVAHLGTVIDTSDLESNSCRPLPALRPSESHLLLACGPLPFEPPFTRQAELAAARFQLAPAPPSLFPLASPVRTA
ncbi:hypothetical protein AB1Y20_007118 [Prymnesium parvum]|uniref:Uncharacterized protein n=1 Tax=Prymnesium parvum TaxID=97485 RepID=A0AB34J2H6_PRYPA